MEILLIRHGLPERLELDEATLADPALAPIGIQQAERLGAWFAEASDTVESVSHIAVSPRLRAVQTAEPLAQKLGLELEVVEEFAEIDRSSSMYIPVEEMRREQHPQWKRLLNQEWAAAGFMDPQKFKKEVLKGFWGLLDRHDGGEIIAIVCHGGTINAIVSEILGLKDFFFFEPDYTSVSRLRTGFRGQDKEKKGKKDFRVRTLNETGHLYAQPNSLDPLPKI